MCMMGCVCTKGVDNYLHEKAQTSEIFEKVGNTLIQSNSLANLFDSSKEKLDLKSKGFFMRISFDSGGEG